MLRRHPAWWTVVDSRAGQRRDIPHARREGVIDRQRGQNGNFRDVTAAGGFGAND